MCGCILADFDPEQDQEVKVNIDMDFSTAVLAAMVRNQLLKDARRQTNLFGKYAQRQKKPRVVQPNAVQRIW